MLILHLLIFFFSLYTFDHKLFQQAMKISHACSFLWIWFHAWVCIKDLRLWYQWVLDIINKYSGLLINSFHYFVFHHKLFSHILLSYSDFLSLHNGLTLYPKWYNWVHNLLINMIFNYFFCMYWRRRTFEARFTVASWSAWRFSIVIICHEEVIRRHRRSKLEISHFIANICPRLLFCYWFFGLLVWAYINSVKISESFRLRSHHKNIFSWWRSNLGCNRSNIYVSKTAITALILIHTHQRYLGVKMRIFI